MLEWITRGLRKGRVTTRYPARAEVPPEGWAGTVALRDGEGAPASLVEVCPSGAISVERGYARLDRARCISCGECVRLAPERFSFVERYECAARDRSALVVARDGLGSAEPAVAPSLGEQEPALRRSLHVRHVDAGSDGSEEWEIQALWNPCYDIQRLGFFLTAPPRHADILLVTGAVTGPMRAPLERTWQVMPEPKALVAVGSEACSGALTGGGGLTAGGVDQVLPVDVYVPGSPPPPIAIMHGLLVAAGLLREEGAS
jgi:Ni,Fe-hydrogenase III small subunit/ferredoxin